MFYIHDFYKQTKLWSLLGVFFLTLFSSAHALAQTLAFKGKALDPDSLKLLYTEEHLVEIDGGDYLRASVSYKDPRGGLIASKNLEFADAPYAPKLRFLHTGSRREYITDYVDQGLQLKTKGSSADTAVNLPLGTNKLPIVVDGGFDRFLIGRWADLLLGEELSFEFLVLDRGTTMRFDLVYTGEKGDIRYFEIRPSSWFVSLLMSPIKLEYSNKHRRLERYHGITNIRTGTMDENYTALIEYEYYDERESFVTEAETAIAAWSSR